MSLFTRERYEEEEARLSRDPQVAYARSLEEKAQSIAAIAETNNAADILTANNFSILAAGMKLPPYLVKPMACHGVAGYCALAIGAIAKTEAGANYLLEHNLPSLLHENLQSEYGYIIISNLKALGLIIRSDFGMQFVTPTTMSLLQKSLHGQSTYEYSAETIALIAERKEGAPLITSGIVTDIEKFTQRDHYEELRQWDLNKIEFFVAILGRIQKAIGCVRPEDAIEPRPYPSPEA